jgi:Ca2+-binding EF-hand superfamily protein
MTSNSKKYYQLTKNQMKEIKEVFDILDLRSEGVIEV